MLKTGDFNVKRLKPTPIIPADLYVTRSADRQVKRIVDDMGRPGYVLVARQMGKTNLLLHAKRELEGENDCFLYLDVSNIFPDISGFFRNIIDTALDAHPEHLGEIAERIYKRRASSILPHKEHELELRDILRAIKGKMIVCLDEIDALTKTDYSDAVFSFLRSIYFSGRINFPEFSRLTYLLSGVAEPKALIKNRDVSPFNIGEKIFLDNFSRDEFSTFIDKSGLDFSSVICDRIYYWMNGNPRMTWDICSKLEDIRSEGVFLCENVIDKTIKEMYLTNFDVPPVDHLRTLAEDDKDIRQALMSIHYEKASAISDAIRSKLYLHGFVHFIDDNLSVKMKNLVIEESLSESWLQDVEQRKTSLLERADNKMKEGAFQDALSFLVEYVDTANSDKDLGPVYFSMGRCNLEILNYPKALSCFELAQFDTNEVPGRFLARSYHIGLCYRKMNRTNEAIDCLKNVISEGERLSIRKYHYDAAVALSTAYLAINSDSDVLIVTDSILNSEAEVREVAKDNRHANELLFAANFNASLALEGLGRKDEAKKCLLSALDLADELSKVGIFLQLAKLMGDSEEAGDYYNNCLSHILDNRVPIAYAKADRPLDFDTEKLTQLLFWFNSENTQNSIDSLFSHVFSSDIKHHSPATDIFYSAVFNAISGSDHDKAIALIEKALNFSPPELESEMRRKLITYGIILRQIEDIAELESLYFSEYLQPDCGRLIESDYRLCYRLVRGYLEKGDVLKAKSVLGIFKNGLERDNSFSNSGSGTIIKYLELLLKIKAGEDFHSDAVELTEYLKQHKNTLKASLYFDESIFHDMERWLKNILVKHGSRAIRRSAEKIGRNDRVKVCFKNGHIMIDKFKRIEALLEVGECEILEILTK